MIAVSKHISPIQHLHALLESLTNHDLDGRIISAKGNGRCLIQLYSILSSEGLALIKYILLNPADCFKPIIDEARSVVLAGGTMSPISDFSTQVRIYWSM